MVDLAIGWLFFLVTKQEVSSFGAWMTVFEKLWLGKNALDKQDKR